MLFSLSKGPLDEGGGWGGPEVGGNLGLGMTPAAVGDSREELDDVGKAGTLELLTASPDLDWILALDVGTAEEWGSPGFSGEKEGKKEKPKRRKHI